MIGAARRCARWARRAPEWVAVVGLAVAAGPAQAGTGPWVLAPGDSQVFIGMEGQRFGRLAVSTGSFTDDVLQVDQGVSTFGAKLITTFGLVRGVELEAELPYYVVVAGREDGAVCAALGLGACRTTQGVGPVVARGKVMLADQVYGAPVSASLGVDLRFGQPTAGARERITNIGEGTFDLEAHGALGGSHGMGPGYWTMFADVGFRYRFPNTRDYVGTGVDAPGAELLAVAEALFTPRRKVTFGPGVSLLWRPGGVDFEEAVLTDVDRFAALRIFALNAGAKLIVRGSDRVVFSVAAFHTMYAINNPTDVLQVSAGVAVRDPFRRPTAVDAATDDSAAESEE